MAALRSGDVTNAGVDALNADATLTTALGGAKTYTNVPEQTTAPYVVWLGCRENTWAEVFDSTGDDGARQIEARCRIVSAERGIDEIETLSSRVIDVLTTPATWSGMTGFQVALFASADLPIQTETQQGTLWFVRDVAVRVFLSA